MKLKKFGAVMVAILALGAVMAGSAFATATTEAKQWYTGTTEAGVTTLPVGTSQTVTAEIGEHPVIGKKIIEEHRRHQQCAGRPHRDDDSDCVIHNLVIAPGPTVVATFTGTLVITGT